MVEKSVCSMPGVLLTAWCASFSKITKSLILLDLTCYSRVESKGITNKINSEIIKYLQPINSMEKYKWNKMRGMKSGEAKFIILNYTISRYTLGLIYKSCFFPKTVFSLHVELRERMGNVHYIKYLIFKAHF